MAAWDLVKDLNLDLSSMSAKHVQSLIDNMDSGDINKVIADLKKAKSQNNQAAKYLDLALSIAQIVLTKGISLV